MNDLLLPIPDEPLEFDVIRPLTEADIAAKGRNSKQTALKRITERHHAMARAMVMGMEPIEVAITFNLSPDWVKELRADPAFQELMTFYGRAETLTLRSTQERMAGVANEAIDLIEERLENEATRGKITVGQALEIAKTFADRTGNGPQTTSVQVNIHAGLADRMAEARRRAQAAMIDITPQEAAE